MLSPSAAVCALLVCHLLFSFTSLSHAAGKMTLVRSMFLVFIILEGKAHFPYEGNAIGLEAFNPQTERFGWELLLYGI